MCCLTPVCLLLVWQQVLSHLWLNQMASMLGDGVIAAVGFIVIFIVGHSLNLAINLLGAYVHTNRLQFVEFFGKFYEGGGRPFNPFKLTTKYVDVKEETYL